MKRLPPPPIDGDTQNPFHTDIIIHTDKEKASKIAQCLIEWKDTGQLLIHDIKDIDGNVSFSMRTIGIPRLYRSYKQLDKQFDLTYDIFEIYMENRLDNLFLTSNEEIFDNCYAVIISQQANNNIKQAFNLNDDDYGKTLTYEEIELEHILKKIYSQHSNMSFSHLIQKAIDENKHNVIISHWEPIGIEDLDVPLFE